MSEYKHYCYKILFETGHVYFGVRSCLCDPIDDYYLGSPKTHKNYWDTYEPKKTILKTFDTREEAEEAERFLINWQWNSTDGGKEKSLNASIYSYTFNTLGTTLSEKRIQEKSKDFQLISPEGLEIKGVNLERFARENNLMATSLAAVIKGNLFNYKGYTANLKNYSLYSELKENRGVTKCVRRSAWWVSWQENKNRKKKYFKLKQDAIAFRDKLEKEGHRFRVLCHNWKEKIKELENK